MGPGKEDELVAARQAALAARAVKGADQAASIAAAAPAAAGDANGQPEEATEGGGGSAVPPVAAHSGGLAEALERVQQLAAEKIRERQRAEQEQEMMRASHAATDAGTSVGAAEPTGALLVPSCSCCINLSLQHFARLMLAGAIVWNNI